GLVGWRFADRLGKREEPSADPVSIVVYREDEAGEVLVDMVARGIRAWIVCRTLPAYALLLHDYLRPLGMLNQREDTGTLSATVHRLNQTLAEVLEERAHHS